MAAASASTPVLDKSGSMARASPSQGGLVVNSVVRRRDEMLSELAPTTHDPFPELLALDLSIDPDAAMEEPETLPDSYCPDGMEPEWWSKLLQYRARKVRERERERPTDLEWC